MEWCSPEMFSMVSTALAELKWPSFSTACGRENKPYATNALRVMVIIRIRGLKYFIILDINDYVIKHYG